MTKKQILEGFKTIQHSICKEIEKVDNGSTFEQNIWQHSQGGGGDTRIFRNGNIIEKGGVNFSAVHGNVNSELKKQLKIEADADFFATGVSIVMHPKNPWVPIIHMNIRYFELSNGVYWFGGGIDLTPHYILLDQAKWFHQELKSVCDLFGEDLYIKFKNEADQYFFLPHRNETRGIGGIFFDHLNHEKNTSWRAKENIYHFVTKVGEAFAPIYTYLMKLNSVRKFSENQKKWQLLRRGRYVEFNLAWDRGTKFGLVTGGRTESILMSLPSVAAWEYDYTPEPHSLEEETLKLLRKEINWLA